MSGLEILNGFKLTGQDDVTFCIISMMNEHQDDLSEENGEGFHKDLRS